MKYFLYRRPNGRGKDRPAIFEITLITKGACVNYCVYFMAGHPSDCLSGHLRPAPPTPRGQETTNYCKLYVRLLDYRNSKSIISVLIISSFHFFESGPRAKTGLQLLIRWLQVADGSQDLVHDSSSLCI